MPLTREVKVTLPALFVDPDPMLVVPVTVCPFRVAADTLNVAPERSFPVSTLSCLMMLSVAYPMFEEELAALS